MLKKNVVLDDFITWYHVWRKLNIGSGVKFPIPKCNKLIPYEHAFWNVAKGGSDTMTKLFWNCQAKIPIQLPQSTLVARLLLVYATSYHRLLQFSSRGKDFDDYPTLQHFRNAANKRYPFHKSVNRLCQSLDVLARTDEPDAAVAPAGNTVTFLQQNAPRATRSTNLGSR